MIIGIDGNEANIPNRVGVNEYAFRLLIHLQKLQENGECNDDLIVYLKNKPLPDMPKETQKFKYEILAGDGLWIITKLMPKLFFGPVRPDVFLSPSHYVPLFAPMPRVCAIMDLGYLEFSGQFTKKVFWQLKWWTAISIFISKRIIAISNSTKKDIVRHYPFANNKVTVVPLAYDKDRFDNAISQKDVRRVKNRYSIVDDYVLYLGTLKPSKNIEGLIEAFSKLDQKDEIKLVIAGKKGWLYDSIFKKVTDLGLSNRVIFTDFITEADKPALIKGAKVFVLASFWEGFGLDVLNAMALGVPVVTSNIGSLPEVVGKTGVMVDPGDSEGIKKGIEKVLTMSQKEYNKWALAGTIQAKQFSWEKTARETLKVLEESV